MDSNGPLVYGRVIVVGRNRSAIIPSDGYARGLGSDSSDACGYGELEYDTGRQECQSQYHYSREQLVH